MKYMLFQMVEGYIYVFQEYYYRNMSFQNIMKDI